MLGENYFFMDAHEFIDAIKLTVEESALETIKSNLSNPPGKKPDVSLVKMSQWFNALSERDKEMVLNVAREAAKSTLFGFFCVLDGVRTLENDYNKGELKLYFEKNGEQKLLNDTDGELLHELYTS
jgi:hypothetical protein